MKAIKFILIGALFGIIMTKSEAISWFRIQEMFRFQSFHMYGIICSAVILGIIIIAIIKRLQLKDIDGATISIASKPPNYRAALIGGSIFGLGWALTGACPGPLYVLMGNGYIAIIITIISAVLGTYLYGIIKDNLPH